VDNLKKLLSISLLLALILTLLSFSVIAEDTVKVVLNGNEINFNQPPIIENGRTLVPIRAVFEALGADVYWDGPNQIVGVIKNDVKIFAKVGENDIMKFTGKDFGVFADALQNEETIPMITLSDDVPARLINGRVLVPIRTISEGMGVDVQWDEHSKTVLLSCDEEFISQQNEDKLFFSMFILFFDSATGTDNVNHLKRTKESYKDYSNVATIKITGFSDFETYVQDREFIEAKATIMDAQYTFDLSQKDIITIVLGYEDGFDIYSFTESLTSEVKFYCTDADNNKVLDRVDVESAKAVWNGEMQAFDLVIKLNSEGQKKLSVATENITKMQDNILSMYFDDQLISSPRVMDRIDSEEVIIAGKFYGFKAHKMAYLLSNTHTPENLNIELTIDTN